MDVWLVLIVVLLGGVCLALGWQLRPPGGAGRDADAARHALEDALARADDLVLAIRALTRELEQTGADVANQSAERLEALKIAMVEADKRREALEPAAASVVAPVPAAGAASHAAVPEDMPSRGRQMDMTLDDYGAQPSDGQGRMAERYEQVYRLADQGRTVEEIAQQTQAGKGEIELILSLRHSR